MVGLYADDGGGGGAIRGTLDGRRRRWRRRCSGCGEWCGYLWWVGGLVYCKRCVPGVFMVWRPPVVGFRFRGYGRKLVQVGKREGFGHQHWLEVYEA